MRKVVTVVIVLLAVFGLYEIGSAIYISQTTGVLEVTASDKSATLTVSQPEQGMSNIGTGSARIRLKPGDYTLIASKDRTQVTLSIRIYKKTVTSSRIELISTKTKQTLDSNAAANLLIKLLPFYGPNNQFKVDYTYSYSGQAAQPTIVITSPDAAGKSAALAWIRSVGIDPAKLPIKYQFGQPQ